MKTRLFTALLAVLMLLPSCALNVADKKVPTVSVESIPEGDAYGDYHPNRI